MGKEVGTMQFRVQGEHIKKLERKKRKNEYKEKMYEKRKTKNMSMYTNKIK
jgi:hypothetical protein